MSAEAAQVVPDRSPGGREMSVAYAQLSAAIIRHVEKHGFVTTDDAKRFAATLGMHDGAHRQMLQRLTRSYRLVRKASKRYVAPKEQPAPAEEPVVLADDGTDPDPEQTQNWRGLPVPRHLPELWEGMLSAISRADTEPEERLPPPTPAIIASDDRGPVGSGGRMTRTIQTRTLSDDEIAAGKDLADVDTSGRPTNRNECRNGPRPCPWASCKHHLALDVNPNNGNLTIYRPTVNVADLEHTCSLDIADAGGATLDVVGRIMNVSRERIRQVEADGLWKVRFAGGPALASAFEELEPRWEDDAG